MYRSTNMSVHQAMSCHDHATCQDVEKPRKSLELSSSLKTTIAFIWFSPCWSVLRTNHSPPSGHVFRWTNRKPGNGRLLVATKFVTYKGIWVQPRVGFFPSFHSNGWSDWQPSLVIGNRSIAILEILSNREGQVVPGHEGPAIYCTSAGGILESGGG